MARQPVVDLYRGCADLLGNGVALHHVDSVGFQQKSGFQPQRPSAGWVTDHAQGVQLRVQQGRQHQMV